MKPYNVEIFTQDFEMVGNTNVFIRIVYEHFPDMPADKFLHSPLPLRIHIKQDMQEEYAGIITEIEYGTDKSKKLQSISYKPLMELLNNAFPTLICTARCWISSSAFTRMPYFSMAGMMTESMRFTIL